MLIRNLKAYLVLLLLSASATVGGEERYICVADNAVGFSYEPRTGKWGEADFIVDHKYVISQAQDGRHEWMVNTVSGVKVVVTCGDGFYREFLNCDDSLLQSHFFRFNKKRMRFISTSISGYHNDAGPSLRETPNMEIGTCSRF
jgi:hypothetical protein